MLRLTGAVLLLLGTGGYSFCLCRELRERLRCLYEMKRMYEQFDSQVGYSLAALPELCKMTEPVMKSPFAQLLHDIYEEAEQNTGKAFPLIWEEQVKKHFVKSALKKEDIGLLMEFSRSFGHADRKLQKQAIENQLALLTALLQKQEAQLAEREKMIMSLGIMGGLLLVILLL